MTEPIRVEVPHTLGAAEARRRVEVGLSKVADRIPGGVLADHRWDGDVLSFSLSAMGQQVDSVVDVRADRVIATVRLPLLLSLFAEKVRDKLQSEGTRLLR